MLASVRQERTLNQIPHYQRQDTRHHIVVVRLLFATELSRNSMHWGWANYRKPLSVWEGGSKENICTQKWLKQIAFPTQRKFTSQHQLGCVNGLKTKRPLTNLRCPDLLSEDEVALLTVAKSWTIRTWTYYWEHRSSTVGRRPITLKQRSIKPSASMESPAQIDVNTVANEWSASRIKMNYSIGENKPMW